MTGVRRWTVSFPNGLEAYVTANEHIADDARSHGLVVSELREASEVIGLAVDAAWAESLLTEQLEGATQAVAHLAVSLSLSRLNSGVQDDLEQREAALGRAMALAHGMWRLHGYKANPDYGFTPTDGPLLTEWPDVVRWITDTQGGERDGNDQGDAAQEQASPGAPGPEPPDQVAGSRARARVARSLGERLSAIRRGDAP